MKPNYNNTIRACFVGYMVQGIVNGFAPLLFITFQSIYGIPLARITLLITFNFLLQLGTDFASAFFVPKIGYRASAVIAHVMAGVGLISLGVLPNILPNPFVGLLISVALYAVGGGLIEVIISPMVEACPGEYKDKTMSLLHSFYSWGSFGMIALSTLFFNVFGIENWAVLSIIWSIIPLANAVFLTRVPIVSLEDTDEAGLSAKGLFKLKIFWVFLILMCCAGASELVVSQWASAFTERALGISKSVGDLLGPALFAVLMGISRFVYGKYGHKIKLNRMILISSVLCTVSYLVISLIPNPIIGLLGIAASGFSVGIMWPGIYSKSSLYIKGGGTAMFAFLALAGDIGCTLGPTFAGQIAGMLNDNLNIGILASTVFPLVLTIVFYFVTKNEGTK